MRTDRGLRRNEHKQLATALLVLAVLAGGVACSNSYDGETTATGTYTGTLSGSGLSGTLSLTIAPAMLGAVAAIEGYGTPVSGTLDLGGTPITLVGSFDPQTGSLTVAGGNYTFSGQVHGGQILGTWTGPGGTGGSFVALFGGTGTISVLCGPFVCDTPPTCETSGRFNLVAGVNVALLAATVDGGQTGFAVGSYIGSAVHFVSGTITIDGTISGGAVSGTWSDSADGASGTWQGSNAGCSVD